jgi:DNA-binding transcriptional MerR regulator
MKKKYLIGDISKLYNISIENLRYYDRIGLLEPIEIDEKNRYRYYRAEQFKRFNTIKYLKSIGMSLKSIKGYFNNRYPEFLLKLLKDQKKNIEDKIKTLTVLLEKINYRIELMEESLSCENIGKVEIVSLKERTIAHRKTKIKTENDMELNIRKLVNDIKIDDSSLLLGEICFTVSHENILDKNFLEYDSVNIVLKEKCKYSDEICSIIYSGEYAKILYRGLYSDSGEYFQRIMNYIQEHNYKIAGDAIIRALIDEYISIDESKYVTEIQIPVAKLI